jgi:hypothetical protein
MRSHAMPAITVVLSRGQTAQIDEDDLTLVSQFRWYANPSLSGFYAMTKVRRPDGRFTTLYMHRLITGAQKGKEVDHINRDTLDNRRANLRVGSHKVNMENGKFALTTHCPRGHAYDEANTYINAKGKRICRKCNAERVAAVYAHETPEAAVRRAARKKAYYEENGERFRQLNREYAASRKDEKREYDRRRRAALKREAP